MKLILSITLILLGIANTGFNQEVAFFLQNVDSLKNALGEAKDDTSRVRCMEELCFRYGALNFDSANKYGNQGIILAQQIHYSEGEVRLLNELAGTLQIRGDIAGSLKLLFKALQIADEKHYLFGTAFSVSNIGITYWYLKDYDMAISNLKKAARLLEVSPFERHLYDIQVINGAYLGNAYIDSDKFDSAYIVLQKLYNATLNNYWHAGVMESFGYLLFKMGDHQKGLDYLRQCIEISEDPFTSADACRWIAECYGKINKPDSAVYYAKKGLDESQKINYQLGILATCKILADEYEISDLNQSHIYLKLFIAADNALYGEKKVLTLQKTLAEEEERLSKAEVARTAYETKLRQYAFLAGLGILFLIAFILYRNNRQKQKVNEILEKTLANLKSTQSQLIQSEKMASLGELTAGIAHEIQNPLNFVNNFSDVNRELLQELKNEVDNGNIEEIKQLANDVISNEEKINHHGKRADSIVKGMLQHSRSSTRVKEPTDINVLADEYLRLSYHGLRAKDKDFNVTMNTGFDESIGKISIIPQDIGRVLLNLINNAFYAVNEKRAVAGTYEPIVSVSTKKEGTRVIIKVKDNGNGIPQKIVGKIFQPFFTTKPTGLGTGLGLSLSYDIVKAHGGELKVETNEGEGSEFLIVLPV